MRTPLVALVALAVAGLTAPVALAPDAASAAPEILRIAGQIAVESPEGEALQAELDVYAMDRDVTIVYEEFENLDETITGPNPPDLMIVPQPGNLVANAPELIDLTQYVKSDKLRRDYSDYLIDQVTVDGAVVGVPVKGALKSLVWYRPAEFAASGYQVPETFAELIALSDAMVANGQTPWCAYMGSGQATGWMGTDWVEDLLLTAEGPDVYDQWVAHDVLFVDPRIEAAFERFQQMMDTPGYVFDRGNLLNENFWNNSFPLGFGDCFMHKQASFFAAAIQGAAFDLDEFATFEFPPVDPAYADAAMGGGDYVAAITDSLEVRQLVRFMASPRFGGNAIADSETGWILPNTRFNSARYGDDMTRSFGQTVQAALAVDQFRFDGSDLMPPEVGANSFWAGIRDLMSGARNVQQVLTDIDSSWPA